MKKNYSFEEIYRLYMNDLFYYMLSLTRQKEAAEDLVQESFYRALIHLDSYRGDEVRPWLFRIAYNAFIDWYRKEKRTVPQDIQEWQLPAVKSTEQQFMATNEIYEWKKDLTLLPVAIQNILILRDFHGFSYQEIAEMTGYTLGKIKMDLFRGRIELKKAREKLK
ncbi:RNA polymerase sigma factor [Neobacillus soli]|uniref:RNA polymerase sigma factor n=1 Tax=Neobacillus soli TaxID=220688 RepID=UPI00082706B0|nr:RNA polymerase sigma factor [Neobacillus soli]